MSTFYKMFYCGCAKVTGTLTSASYSGSPEGLSFMKTTSPPPDTGAIKESVAFQGTKFSVIHSPSACPYPCPITLPFLSRIFIGNDASKNQFPRACPVTVSGLKIASSLCRLSILMSSVLFTGAGIFGSSGKSSRAGPSSICPLGNSGCATVFLGSCFGVGVNSFLVFVS